jgi:hypothetical protein
MPLDPKEPIYTNPAAGRIVRVVATLSIIGVLASIAIVWFVALTKNVVCLYILIGAWAVFPPAWFWYEYYYVYRRWGKPDTMELFKHGQDVSKAIWAGVLAALIGFAASDESKPPKAPNNASGPRTISTNR